MGEGDGGRGEGRWREGGGEMEQLHLETQKLHPWGGMGALGAHPVNPTMHLK